MWPAVARFYEIVSRGGYANVMVSATSASTRGTVYVAKGRPSLVNEHKGDVTGLEGDLLHPLPNSGPGFFVPMHFRIVRTNSSQTTELSVHLLMSGETLGFTDAQTV